MENLYFNLSEEEFSRGRKVLLWSFAILFLLASVYVLAANLVFGHKSLPIFISFITLGISLFVAIIAAFASIKRKDLFFAINDDSVEFRFGILNAKRHSFKWTDIKELTLPNNQKKVMLHLNDGSTFLINLNWLQNKKSSLIRKHLYQEAKQKNLRIIKVPRL